MFKSMLNVVALDAIILDIFIILAVVVAGALVVYFLGEAINSMITKSHKNVDEVPNFGQKEPKQEEQLVVVHFDEPEKTAEEPEKMIDEEKLTEVDEVKAEEEHKEAENEISEEERLNAERRAYLEARRQELIRRMQAEMADEDEEESEEEEETPAEEQHEEEQKQEETTQVEVAEGEEVTEETSEPETEEKTAEENVVEEKASETQEESDNLSEERQALLAEKERYAIMVKELEEAKRALVEQNAKQAEEAQKPQKGVLTLDELKEKLAAAEERLAKTEKEFKQCKKEYIPLRRIWTAHERDEKKLRRKEALVARQKVLLYGVNNFADIDEEKAKKLAEDLDHLDGLKLSVQHCEEVMAENAERYPLLEKMYGVLSQRNEELKKDIETYKQEIARLEAEEE